MARKARSKEEVVPYGANEVDAFAAKREKVLLEDAGLAGMENDDSDDGFLLDDEEEEEVMSMSEGDSSSESDAEKDDDEELDGEKAYKKVFGRSLNTMEDAERGDGMLENENAWGSSRKDYYGADGLEDDEMAKEIEKEALKQQKKHMQELNMQDFLEEDVEEDWIKEAKDFDMDQFQESTSNVVSVSVTDVLNMDLESKDKFLQTSFPEFSPLSKEFQKQTIELEILRASGAGEVRDVKIMALTSYLGTIASYFAVFMHELKHNEEFSTMKDHPIMESILMSKEIWIQAKDLTEAKLVADEEQESEDEKEATEIHKELLEQLDEQEGVEEDEKVDNQLSENETEGDEFEIDISKSRLSSKKKTDTIDSDADDYLESEMADVIAQEKKARKRTLRFYTSKIDQQANKKTDKFKGDDDIPYKERLFERQQRLVEEARKRGMRDENDEVLGADYSSEDERTSKALNEASEQTYYDQVRKGKTEKKQSRIQAHYDALQAAREGKLAEMAEEVGEDGKRAINYQILKNKGLTPKRKKENRNSRVKKRKKFEKAQKKLKSVRAVYSGGQNGAYEGEKTGIRRNITKSVTFKS